MASKTLPPENSVAIRVICCAMAIIAVTASFVFGESAVPVVQMSFIQLAVVFLCVWLCIGGGIFSYFYRNAPPPVVSKLIKIGAALIVINLGRELWDENLVSLQFQFVRPLMHALVAASVLTSFELRTRGDIISSATFGLVLLSVAATSGKSMLFGIFVFLYICLGGALLMLSCYSQTRNEIAPAERTSLVKQVTRGNTKLATVLAALLLPLASVAVFCVMPRLDNEADSVSAQIRSLVASTIYSLRQKQHNVDAVPASLLEQQKAEQKFGPNRMKAVRRREALKRQKMLEQQRELLAEATIAPTNRRGGAPAPTASDKTDPRVEKQPNSKPNNAHPKSDKKPDQPKPTEKAPTPTPTPTPAPQKSSKTTEPSKPSNTKPSKPTTKNPSPTKPDQTEKSPPPTAATEPSTPPEPDEHIMDVSDGIANPEDPLFTLACTRSVYTKSITLDHFDGTRWTRKDTGDEVWFFRPETKGITFDCPPFQMSYALPIMEVAQTFTVDHDMGHAVPVAGIPQQLSLLQAVTVDAFGNIWANSNLTKGTEYSVVGEVPVYSLEAMRKATTANESMLDAGDEYLQMPDAEGPELTELALDTAGTQGNRFARAENIMMYLRKNYKYETAPVKAKVDTGYVDNFLFDKKTGDCKAFASAFILMCRAAEIPARCVTGFLPGDFDPVTGATHVKRKHAHAWAEVYIPPYGWVPFDATPTGMLPARPEETYYNYDRVRKELENYRKQANSTTEEVIKRALDWAGIVLGVIGLGVALFALYLAVRATRGLWRNWLRLAARRHPASKIRDKLVKRLQRIGVTREASDTGADVVNKLRQSAIAARSPELPAKVHDFMSAYNATYFGRENRLDELKSLDREIGGMLRELSKMR